MAFERLHAAFQRAASSVPAYRRLLQEHDVDASAIVDCGDIRGPLPDSHEGQYVRPVCHRSAVRGRRHGRSRGRAHQLRSWRTFFVRAEHAAAARRWSSHDRLRPRRGIFDSQRRTLVINCLPMGVGFSSATATVATTSVREDMAMALVSTFGAHYEQIIIVDRSTVRATAARPRAREGSGLAEVSRRGRHRRGDLRRALPQLRGGKLGLDGAARRRLHHVVIRCRRARSAPVL